MIDATQSTGNSSGHESVNQQPGAEALAEVLALAERRLAGMVRFAALVEWCHDTQRDTIALEAMSRTIQEATPSIVEFVADAAAEPSLIALIGPTLDDLVERHLARQGALRQ